MKIYHLITAPSQCPLSSNQLTMFICKSHPQLEDAKTQAAGWIWPVGLSLLIAAVSSTQRKRPRSRLFSGSPAESRYSTARIGNAVRGPPSWWQGTSSHSGLPWSRQGFLAQHSRARKGWLATELGSHFYCTELQPRTHGVVNSINLHSVTSIKLSQ